MSIGQPFRFSLPFYTFNQHHPRRRIMELGLVVSRLNVLTPPALAESWDNVGLWWNPATPPEEAVECGANVIVSYHPPIFKALKHLTCASWKERLMIRAIETPSCLFSTHLCDALANGVNDWLRSIRVKQVHTDPSFYIPQVSGTYGHLLEFIPDPSGNILSRVKNLQDVSVRTSNVTYVPVICVSIQMSSLGILTEEPSVYSSVEVLNLQKMSHHDVLDAVAEGCSVVLCEHSNSERGYLQLGSRYSWHWMGRWTL
ncbi:hypothetical protein GDO86_020189 [Hymenochirus boettgeri]|uniref:NIF3-like protein 1 n=1 Tax=Hymenochirus boettgeri TaxID=247094 RepID=A0A8T2IGX8_9PIPI|nr:hypothetical protein GDO86_020189 [Hymenochirus boettgeri]